VDCESKNNANQDILNYKIYNEINLIRKNIQEMT
jgi:hypothetical protein